ncbi:MAG: YihY/virulence factor BrkB family protein [Bryobacteraceae bacterium]|nr:YihY/virulence factor BrkB family protein [Bryobacteraceae bacterium]
MPRLGEVKDLLVKSYQQWDKDQVPRLGAALSFYTMLSLAPLLILLIAVAGVVFGEEAARGQLFFQIRELVGEQGAEAIQTMVQNANKPGSGIIASVLGFLTLVVGASSVAGELQSALNIIWMRTADLQTSFSDSIRQKSRALGVVIGCGFLLLVSLVVSSGIAAAGKLFGQWLPLPEVVLAALNFVLGVLVIAAVFAVMFRYLPVVQLQWRDVLAGALFTSVLFSIGKLLIGLYLGKASIGSTYGAAGSLVVVLVWVYYSSQIFFFGAEFTQVYSCERGSDPLKLKERVVNEVEPAPKPVLTMDLAQQAASGNTALSAEDRTTGLLGSVLGSALAISRLLRGSRK